MPATGADKTPALVLAPQLTPPSKRSWGRSRSLGARQRRRLLAPSHDWLTLLAAGVRGLHGPMVRLHAGPEGASDGSPAALLPR
jgi:hypothetical protein